MRKPIYSCRKNDAEDNEDKEDNSNHNGSSAYNKIEEGDEAGHISLTKQPQEEMDASTTGPSPSRGNLVRESGIEVCDSGGNLVLMREVTKK